MSFACIKFETEFGKCEEINNASEPNCKDGRRQGIWGNRRREKLPQQTRDRSERKCKRRLCEESDFFLKETPWMAMKIENGNPDLKYRNLDIESFSLFFLLVLKKKEKERGERVVGEGKLTS